MGEPEIPGVENPFSKGHDTYIQFHQGMMDMVDAGFSREEAFDLLKLFIQNGFDNIIIDHIQEQGNEEQ